MTELNRLRGKKAQSQGSQFEELWDLMSNRIQAKQVILPTGAKPIHYKDYSSGMAEKRLKLVGQKTDCDRIIFWEGKSAAVDLKTWEDHVTLCRSNMKEHQVIAMTDIYRQGIPAGYVVWYRKINMVAFHNAAQLWAIWNHRGSFAAKDGLLLGTWDNFDVRKVLNAVPPARSTVGSP